jgi:hypothetical protein
MDGANTQPHVHSTTVTIVIGDTFHHFRLFYKRHKYLPINVSVREVLPSQEWEKLRGDVVVMKLASDGDRVVNMLRSDVPLAKMAMLRLTLSFLVNDQAHVYRLTASHPTLSAPLIVSPSKLQSLNKTDH